jgi:hypothetical protein
MLRAQQFLKILEMPGNKQERITTTLRSKSFLQQMCADVPYHLVQSARPGFKPLWILSSRSGLDSANLPHRTYIQASNLRFGYRMEIEEVLQVEKNLATEQRTRRRSRFVVQGGLGRIIERLSFYALDL